MKKSRGDFSYNVLRAADKNGYQDYMELITLKVEDPMLRIAYDQQF